jgi:hypothetical protein
MHIRNYVRKSRNCALQSRREKLSRIHAEEDHRWTRMNTDSEGWTPVLLRLALGHCPVNGFPLRKSPVLSSPDLCPSVSICGCIELLRLSPGSCCQRCRKTPLPEPFQLALILS